MPQQTGPWSSGSYAHGGSFRGRIESIDDPEKRNRVQVRVFGYQDDKSSIPKEKLEWIHVLSGTSQIPGSTSSHGFYPGAEVVITDTGTERYVAGAVPGFDGEKRLKNEPSIDTSENQKPDVSVKQRGEGDKKDVGFARSSPGLVNSIRGLTQYFNYDAWPSLIKKLDDYARGKGAPPAPYGKGDQAKLDQLKSIGLDKTSPGSDILNVINGLDGNASGAFKAAISIIQNLRNNGFDIAKNVIGQGPLDQAHEQFNQVFGLALTNDLVELIVALNAANKQVNQLKPNDLLLFIRNGEGQKVINLLSDQRLACNIDKLQTINNGVVIIANLTTSTAIEFTKQFKDEFNVQLNIAYTSLVALIVALASQYQTVEEIVTFFGGVENFKKLALSIYEIAVFLGIPKSTIYAMLAGAVGAALNNTLVISSSQQQSNQNMSTLNMFMGNSVALQEIMSGNKIMESLSKIKLKYEGASDPEHPRNNKPVKKFRD